MKDSEIRSLFEQYYQSYYEEIYKFCLVKVQFRSEYAEDCCQNVFMTLYRKLREGVTVEKPRAYLYTIAANYLHKTYDDIRKNDNDELGKLDASQYCVNMEETVESKLLLEKVATLLNEEELHLIRLRYEQGYSLDEIAAQLQISKLTLSKRIYRIRQKIRNGVKE